MRLPSGLLNISSGSTASSRSLPSQTRYIFPYSGFCSVGFIDLGHLVAKILESRIIRKTAMYIVNTYHI